MVEKAETLEKVEREREKVNDMRVGMLRRELWAR